MRTAEMTVELLDKMGSDLSVVNAARVSMDVQHNEFDTDSDTRLIKYLARCGHWSPFSHATLQFRIKAPIFVARQLVKHQVGLSWNEVSRRYVDSDPEFYVPAMRKRAPNVKQGSLDVEVEDKQVGFVFMDSCMHALASYHAMLNAGVAPEVARSVLPLAAMTEWVWTGSLYAFARVCNLRLDSHAQAETREVARMIYDLMRQNFPVSTNALVAVKPED